MKTKLTALILIAVMALQLTACGKKNDTDNTSSLPAKTESIVETVDTPNTPDEVSTSQVSESTDTETKSDKKTVSSSSASKEEKKNSSSSAVSSKNTSSKKSSSAAASKSVSSKTAQNKTSANTQPTNTTTTANGGNGNTADTNSQNTTTTLPDPEPTPQPEPTPEPEPQPEPTPEPTPEPIDSPYARPFDIDYIRNYMIDYGLERGLILDESLNIDNAAWSSPLNTRWYNDDDSELCFRNCLEEVDSLVGLADYLGATPSDVRFNVQIIEIDEYPGEYRIYVPYG